MAKRGSAAAKGSVAELIAYLDRNGAGGRGRRSSLSRWLRAHHDEFAAMLAAKDAGWDKLAAGLSATAGLLDGNGKPPTGERLRKVWWETRRDKRAAEDTSQARSSSRVAGKIAHPVHVTQEADLAEDRPSLGSGMLSEARPAMQPHPVTPVDIGVADRALDGGGVAHGCLPPESVPSFSMAEQTPPEAQADLKRESGQVEALQPELSTAVRPAAPVLNPGAAGAAPNPLPVPATLAPATTLDPVTSATQDQAMVVPGKARKPFGLPAFLRRST